MIEPDISEFGDLEFRARMRLEQQTLTTTREALTVAKTLVRRSLVLLGKPAAEELLAPRVAGVLREIMDGSEHDGERVKMIDASRLALMASYRMVEAAETAFTNLLSPGDFDPDKPTPI